MANNQTTPKSTAKKPVITIIISILIALLYGISPVDIVPDGMIPVGFVDDVVVAIAAIIQVVRQIKNIKNNQQKGPQDE